MAQDGVTEQKTAANHYRYVEPARLVAHIGFNQAAVRCFQQRDRYCRQRRVLRSVTNRSPCLYFGPRHERPEITWEEWWLYFSFSYWYCLMNDDAKNHYTSICHPNSMNSENAAMNGKSMSHECDERFLSGINDVKDGFMKINRRASGSFDLTEAV